MWFTSNAETWARSTVMIAFVGVSGVTSADVLGEPGDEDARTGAADCADWLCTYLADGPHH